MNKVFAVQVEEKKWLLVEISEDDNIVTSEIITERELFANYSVVIGKPYELIHLKKF